MTRKAGMIVHDAGKKEKPTEISRPVIYTISSVVVEVIGCQASFMPKSDILVCATGKAQWLIQ